MKIFFYCLLGSWLTHTLSAQSLELENIMKGYEWVGHSPNGLRWSVDSKTVYFNWNPENAESDSLYQVTARGGTPQKVSRELRRTLYDTDPVLNRDRSQAVYTKHGDIFLVDLKASAGTRQITNTLSSASNPCFSYDGQKILFTENSQLFSWDLGSGQLVQLTQFIAGKKPPEKEPSGPDKWLMQDQLKLFEVLRERHRKDSLRKARNELLEPRRPLKIYLGEGRVSHITLSPDESYITYRLTMDNGVPKTQVLDYVTESGYAQTIEARPKVGNISYHYQFGIYDIKRDTSYNLNIQALPGIHDIYHLSNGDRSEDPNHTRQVLVHGPYYSQDGKQALVQLRALDNKDRWICLLDLKSGSLELLDRQTDVAWIQGPGIGYLFTEPAMGWLPDNETVWFQSEATGYSHLYTMNLRTKKLKPLTEGDFEVYQPKLSLDKSQWYYSSNETHSGERNFYRMPLKGGKPVRLTHLPGRNDVVLSPDEKYLAVLNSQANRPWELYLTANQKESEPTRVTYSQNAEFEAYPWRVPAYIEFAASDGEMVPARLYKPESEIFNGAAVIFVHGAGYLQNAHKWWSNYYREYMFHNFLADRGYTVLDIDYRGSAGYGRDWRTGIYQFMGGKDLSDQIDGARYLVEHHGVDQQRLGIYGGSYGGFITLMAMFTEPEVFAAGAALRSVTDWAHYNHPYTSNILNQPADDSLAFVKSSPIYHAEGLKGALLMLHGMVDRNVQFQDVVRLSQRLIELQKENWELAVFPMEGHGFKEASSWYDEYRRIFQLFENHLKDP